MLVQIVTSTVSAARDITKAAPTFPVLVQEPGGGPPQEIHPSNDENRSGRRASCARAPFAAGE
jgi:hypothetical protein